MFDFLTEDDARVVEAGSNIELFCQLPDVPHTVSWQFIPSNYTAAGEADQPQHSRFEVSVI